MKRYKDLTLDEKIQLAYKWGILDPEEKSETFLLREILEAVTIQEFCERKGDVEITEGDLVIEYEKKWQDGIKLRQAGAEFSTLKNLLRNGIKRIDQLNLYEKEDLISYDISSGQATLLLRKFKTIPTETQEKEKKTSWANETALKRIGSRR